jgi:hypothetical protein
LAKYQLLIVRATGAENTENTRFAPKTMPFHREKLSVPVLRLEISDTLVTSPSIPPGDGSSNSFPERKRALSNATLPSHRHSQSDIINTTSPLVLSPSSDLPPPLAPGISKARDELQKLLAHILEQLRHRPKCPPSCPPPLQAASAAKSIVPLPSISRTTSEIQLLDSENEEFPERSFSPDVAFDLMNRLRDVLMISHTHGWQIFSER